MKAEYPIRVLQINLRSDYGGGPQHMYKLIANMSSGVDAFAAMPKDVPYWDLNVGLIGAANCFELPHRKFNIIALWNLVRFVRENKIQVVHAQGKGASIYGRLVAMCTGVPCVYTFHGLHYGKYNWLKKQVYFGIERLLALFTEAFIAVSEGERREVAVHLPSLSNKIQLIYNGVDIPETANSCCPENEKVVVCCIARLDFQKNLEMLIPIAQGLQKSLPNGVAIHVVGVKNENNELKRRIDAENLSDIIFLQGFSNDTSIWLRSAHFYLSTSRWEGLPISVLEASAHGLPIIATDVVGNRDAVLDGKTGILFPLEEPKNAVEAILGLVQKPALYKHFSAEGINLIKNKFSVLEMVRKTEELYFRLL